MAGAQVAWGIDVGVSSLKAIKLRRDGDRVTIEAFDVIEHDKFLSEPDADRDALIRSTLQKFMNKYAVRRETVYIGVPGSTTFARFVKLPPVETKKIPEIVRFEAIQQIPFPLDQVNWDYHTFQHPDSPDVEVGIFAMKKELVAGVMSNFRAVEMNVQGVQMSPLAVYNAAAYDGMTHDKGTIVIDMGAEHTDLVIMDQGRLWLRTINIGGNHFTDALAKSFKQPFARAESLKKTAATSKYQKQIYQAMRPIFADLVAEIQRSIGHYNSTHRDSRLDRIVGMGNPFKLPNLQKYLQQELKMEVERLETFRMANVEKAAAFSENILSMTAAYGLAVQALGLAAIDTNLLPTEIARAMMWRKKQPWFIAAAAVIVAGGVALAAQPFMAGADLDSGPNTDKRHDNDAREAAEAKVLNDWKSVNGDFKNAQDQVESQFKLLAGRKVWPQLRMDIFGVLPQVSGGSRPIVITEVDSYYEPHLSTATLLDNPNLAAAGVSPAAPPGGFGASSTQPVTATPQAPAASPASATGESDHGFIVTLSGYVPSSDYGPEEKYKQNLYARAPGGNKARPYYFGLPNNTNEWKDLIAHQIQDNSIGPNGQPFGPSPISTAMVSAGNKPWGNVKGPFWDMFVPDLINYHPDIPLGPGGVPQPQAQGTEPPFAVDVYTTRQNPNSPKLTPMTGAWTFKVRFKVHVREDFQ